MPAYIDNLVLLDEKQQKELDALIDESMQKQKHCSIALENANDEFAISTIRYIAEKSNSTIEVLKSKPKGTLGDVAAFLTARDETTLPISIFDDFDNILSWESVDVDFWKALLQYNVFEFWVESNSYKRTMRLDLSKQIYIFMIKDSSRIPRSIRDNLDYILPFTERSQVELRNTLQIELQTADITVDDDVVNEIINRSDNNQAYAFYYLNRLILTAKIKDGSVSVDSLQGIFDEVMLPKWNTFVEQCTYKHEIDNKSHDETNSGTLKELGTSKTEDRSLTKVRIIIGVILLIFTIGNAFRMISRDYYELESSWTITTLILTLISCSLIFGSKFWIFLFEVLIKDETDDGQTYASTPEKQSESDMRLEYLAYLSEWEANRAAFDRQQSQPLHRRSGTIKQPTETPNSYEMWKISKFKR